MFGKINSLSLFFLASVITSGLGIVINPFLSLKLSHNDFAIMGYFASLFYIVTPLTSLSLNTYYLKNFFINTKEDNESIKSSIFSIYLLIGGINFLVFYAIYFVYHFFYVKNFVFFPYALLSFLPIFFTNFYNLYLLDLRLYNKSLKYFYISVLNGLLSIVVTIILVYILNFGLIGRLGALIISSLIIGGLSIFCMNVKLNFSYKLMIKMLKFSWPLMISAILSFFFLGIDRLFLVNLSDNYNLGLYNIGNQIAIYIGVFTTILFQIFEPDIFKHSSLRQFKPLLKVSALITIITLCTLLLFMIFSRFIIQFLTAGRYLDSIKFVSILCFKNLSMNFAFILSSILVGLGFTKYDLVIKIFGAICSYLIFAYLINKYQYIGAAWGQVLTWILLSVLYITIIFYKWRKKNVIS